MMNGERETITKCVSQLAPVQRVNDYKKQRKH